MVPLQEYSDWSRHWTLDGLEELGRWADEGLKSKMTEMGEIGGWGGEVEERRY